MDKWRNKGKVVAITEDSLLPPTRRIPIVNPSPLLDKRRSKKWSIDGFFKKVSSILDAQSSSSSLEDLSERQRRKIRGKSKGVARAGNALESSEGIDYSPLGIYRTIVTTEPAIRNGGGGDGGALQLNMDQLLEARLSVNSHSRSSDGSLEGGSRRGRCKDRVKARAEAKRRDQLSCVGDSSMDESSAAEDTATVVVLGPRTEGKRRSRASRTERYLKRMCNGGKANETTREQKVADSRNLEGRGCRPDEFQPIERVPRSELGQGNTNGNICTVPRFDSDPSNENFYARHADIGVNPLVQQTLQYFSEFDRNMAAAAQNKIRKTYPGHQHRRKSSHTSDAAIYNEEFNLLQQQQQASVIPPRPPSRDHRSRILVKGSAVDKYRQMLRYKQMHEIPPETGLSQSRYLDKENGYYPQVRPSLHSPNTEVRNINEGHELVFSPDSTMHKYHLPLSPPRSPLRESLNTTTIRGSGAYERNQSPLLDVNKLKHVDRPSPRFSTNLQNGDYENSNYVPFKKSEIEKSNERRSSKNLEEALYELEAIYNSLQLGDEELLERAEKRTMEEFHYKGFAVSPDGFDNENPSSRRKTWGDTALSNFKEEPDRLKDDMAYRRMHPKERPSSVDGQSSLSSISYLMTSPIPSRREMLYFDPKRKPRRKEPDVTLDDVVYRSMQYANNTLKVIQPQPPFGIPLGPITTATDSDYLHTSRTKPERARSPYIPSCEPDLVTDDLAFRNLRKDAQPSSGSRQPSPSFYSVGATSPQSFGLKKKRAVRSLSANLYGLINKPGLARAPLELDSEDLSSANTYSNFEDFFDEVPIKRISRRTSDPELMTANWQQNTWDSLDVNRNRDKETERQREIQQRQLPRENSSELDLSNASCDDSSDERIRSQERLTLGDREAEYKASSDKGSSYLSSNGSTPPPLPIRNVQPITEQEISVYKKLCQDLENLVQLTKGIDSIPVKIEPIVPLAQEISIEKEEPSILKAEENVPSSSLLDENMSKSSVKNIVESIRINDDDKKCKVDEEENSSPLKREISTILDNLKDLREDSNSSHSSCSEEERKEPKKDVVVDDKIFKEITKEICDLATGNDDDDKDVKTKLTKDKEEEERKDKVDNNVFFKKVQLAKISGDWKESTPNNAAINRRTSLTNADNNHWEGMSKCNHKYNSMPAKTSSLLPFRHYGSKRKSSNRKSMCSIS